MFSSRFVRVSISLPSPYCSRCSRRIIHPDATTGYPILARVAIPRLASCHPSISVIIFMPCSPTLLSTARISIFHVGLALLHLSPAPPVIPPPSPTLFNFQDNQAIPPGYEKLQTPADHVFSFSELLVHRPGPCRASPPFLSLFFPCNAIVLVRPATRDAANWPRNFIPRYFDDVPCF